MADDLSKLVAALRAARAPQQPSPAPGEVTVVGSRRGPGYQSPYLGPPIAYPHIPRSQYGKRPPPPKIAGLGTNEAGPQVWSNLTPDGDQVPSYGDSA